MTGYLCYCYKPAGADELRYEAHAIAPGDSLSAILHRAGPLLGDWAYPIVAASPSAAIARWKAQIGAKGGAA